MEEQQLPGALPLDMKTRFMYWILMQGLGVVVLSAWLFITHRENIEQREQNALCNQQVVEIYQAQNKELITILADIRDYLKEERPGSRIKTIYAK